MLANITRRIRSAVAVLVAQQELANVGTEEESVGHTQPVS